MTDNERLVILTRAFANACKWIHDNPPGDLDMYFNHPDYIRALADNSKYPDGRNWQAIFIKEAVEEMNNDSMV